MQRITWISFFIVYILAQPVGLAQPVPSPWLNWTEKDGLLDNRVTSICTDQTGYLWLATSNGVNRFDGNYFDAFQYDPIDPSSIPANGVIQVFNASDGRIWIATEGGGAAVYDPLTKAMTQYQDSLIEERVHCVYEDQSNRIWLGYRAIGNGEGGITCVNKDGSVEHFLVGTTDFAGFKMKVTDMIQDPDQPNIFWLGGRSFFRWNEKTGELKEFPHPGMVPNYEYVKGVGVLNAQYLAVATYDSGILLFDRQKQEWADQLYDCTAFRMITAPDGTLWFAEDNGLAWITEDLEIKYLLHKRDNIQGMPPNMFIDDIHFDKMDNLWIATNFGVYCWNPIMTQFPAFEIQSGAHTQPVYMPRLITETVEGERYFMSSNGVHVLDQANNWLSWIPNPNPEDAFQRVIQGTENLPIFFSNHRLWVLDTEAKKIHPLILSDAQQQALDTVRIYRGTMAGGIIWLGTRNNGLFGIRAQDGAMYHFRHNPDDPNSLCHDNYLFEIAMDSKENIWICTDQGISCLDPKTDTFVDYPLIREKLGKYVIHALEMDQSDRLWIGTRTQGLFYFDLNTEELVQFTIRDGLPYNGVNKMLRVKDQLWMCTRQGLCKMDLNNFEIEVFDDKKGLLSRKLYSAYLRKGQNDQLFLTYQFSTKFTSFNPNEIQGKLRPPVADIEQINLLSQTPIKSKSIPENRTIALGPYENYFSIDFRGIHFLQPKNLQYQYRLVGYDDTWIDGGGNRSAVFTNLKGGVYDFELKVGTEEGTWSVPTTLKIRLATPWYKTIWFRISIAFVMLGIGYLIYRNRVRQIQKESQWQQRLAEMEIKSLRSQINPHFIFNCLNSIKNYIIQKDAVEGVKHINRFSKLIRMVLNNSGARFIPLQQEIEALKLYVELEQMRFQDRFEMELIVEEDLALDSMLVPPLLLQPYVENAIWHGLMPLKEPGKLVIEVRRQQDDLIFLIRDNGIGRKAAAAQAQKTQTGRKSLGLQLNANRLETIKKIYKIETNITLKDLHPDRKDCPGTEVRILFPILTKSKLYDQSSIN